MNQAALAARIHTTLHDILRITPMTHETKKKVDAVREDLAKLRKTCSPTTMNQAIVDDSSIQALVHLRCPECGAKGYRHISKVPNVAQLYVTCRRGHERFIDLVTDEDARARRIERQEARIKEWRERRAARLPALDPTAYRFITFHGVRTGRTSGKHFHVALTPEEYAIIEAHRRKPTDTNYTETLGLRPEDIDPMHPNHRERMARRAAEPTVSTGPEPLPSEPVEP